MVINIIQNFNPTLDYWLQNEHFSHDLESTNKKTCSWELLFWRGIVKHGENHISVIIHHLLAIFTLSRAQDVLFGTQIDIYETSLIIRALLLFNRDFLIKIAINGSASNLTCTYVRNKATHSLKISCAIITLFMLEYDTQIWVCGILRDVEESQLLILSCSPVLSHYDSPWVNQDDCRWPYSKLINFMLGSLGEAVCQLLR